MQSQSQIDIIMRTLAEPTRREVFQRIAATDEISVVELTEGSGVTQGAISQHLKALKQAGLVVDRPEGRRVYYRARPENLSPMIDWIDEYGVFWRKRLKSLRSLLKELDP
jgi:DNA-binding transcriptional ArsR family regulator